MDGVIEHEVEEFDPPSEVSGFGLKDLSESKKTLTSI